MIYALPRPKPAYDLRDQSELRSALEAHLQSLHVYVNQQAGTVDQYFDTSGYLKTGLESGATIGAHTAAQADDATARALTGLSASGQLVTGLAAGATIGTHTAAQADDATARALAGLNLSGQAVAAIVSGLVGQIQSGQIGNNQVLAAHIASINLTVIQAVVGSLSAITANIGTVTAGMIGSPTGSCGILLSGTRPTSWYTFLDLTAVGHQPVLQCGTASGTVNFQLFADGTVYLNPSVVPAAGGVNPIASISTSADDTTQEITVTIALDPTYAGAATSAVIQLGGSTTTYPMSGSGTTFTYAPSDYQVGGASTRAYRCTVTASIPGGASGSRPASSTYPTAAPGGPL